MQNPLEIQLERTNRQPEVLSEVHLVTQPSSY